MNERKAVSVGDGGYLVVWSDHTPVTVSRVSPKGSVWVRADKYKVVSGSVQDGSARYEYTRDPEALEEGPYRWSDKRGCYVRDGYRLHVGQRSRYYDPHI